MLISLTDLLANILTFSSNYWQVWNLRERALISKGTDRALCWWYMAKIKMQAFFCRNMDYKYIVTTQQEDMEKQGLVPLLNVPM